MIQIATSWLLILPILFGLGWLASRWDLRLENRMDERERMRREREQISQDMAQQTNESIKDLRRLAGLK